MKSLNHIFFYQIEKTIKSYRQFAQRKINAAGFDITIDQWLILKTIEESPTATQNQIAANVFKDVASVTRIIELLVNKKYLNRYFNTEDRRRYNLELTEIAIELLQKIQPLIDENRKTALNEIPREAIETAQSTLSKIILNVQ